MDKKLIFNPDKNSKNLFNTVTHFKTVFIRKHLLYLFSMIAEKMKILILFAWISSASIASAVFPSFNIEANSSFLASGDTLVIRCLISNITLLDFVNSYSISWFKDDVQITYSYNGGITDTRYSVHLDLSAQEQNIMSKLQIKSEYFFKFISILLMIVSGFLRN